MSGLRRMQVARGSVGDSDLFLPNPDNEISPPSLDPVLPQDSTWGGGGVRGEGNFIITAIGATKYYIDSCILPWWQIF
jgi:hypothetical protein